jgi:hypothetical protein
MYVKTGDVVQVTVNNSETSTNGVRYTTGISDTPHPDQVDPAFTFNSGQTFSYTVSSATDDAIFSWPFFGTVHPTSGYKYSQLATMRRVSISGSSLSASSVAQGGSVTFSVAGVSGLLSPSGSNDNRLYVVLQKGGSNFTATGANGVTWGTGSLYVGYLTTSATSVVCNIGANMPVGTYTAYVSHYNATASGNNAFFGAGNRLDATPPTFTVISDPNPDAFSFTNQTGLDTSTTYASNIVQLSGMNTAGVVTAMTNVPAASATAYRMSADSNNLGTWYTDTSDGHGTLVMPQNGYIQLKRPTSSSNSTTVDMTVTVGTTTSSDWELTTEAADNPNPDDFEFPNVPAATEGAVTTSDDIDLEGMDIASTVTALNNCSYKIGSGSWQTTTGTAVPADSQITIRTTASSTYDATVTASVTVGTTQSTTWSVTTRSDPAAVDYGLQVLNANGTTEIFGYNTSNTHFLASGSVTIAANDQSDDISCEGMTTSNTSTIGVGVNSQLYAFVDIVREAGSFYITNSSTTNSLTAYYFAYRY